MTPSVIHLLGVFIVGLAIGLYFAKLFKQEGFQSYSNKCDNCGDDSPCQCSKPKPRPICPACPECKQPDMSKYVLKSSIPKQNPVILDCSKCQKPKGECPPCPRARCPDVKCPPPTKCPSCPPCPRASCPPAVVKCKAEEVVPSDQSVVRPYLAPISYRGFGTN